MLNGVAGRVARLTVGLALFGASLAMMVQSHLGLGPWDVLHEGLGKRSGLPIGYCVIIVGVIVVLAWIPLGVRIGWSALIATIGTGLSLNGTLSILSAPDHLGARIALLVFGVLLNGVATGIYIGARFGPGPRDGLMTGLADRGWSIRRARCVIELTVLAIGALLGGTVGIGTVLYALGIGPLVHIFIPLFAIRPRADAT